METDSTLKYLQIGNSYDRLNSKIFISQIIKIVFII